MANHPTLRKACRVGVMWLCLGLLCIIGYQIVCTPFSLAEFVRRAVLVSVTASVALLLHRILLYRLPPQYLLCLWVVVLIQMAGISLPQVGVFMHGLKNQLPTIQMQQPVATATPSAQTDIPIPALPNEPLPMRPQEVTLSYASGETQTLSYSETLAGKIQLVWIGGMLLCLGWFWGNYAVFAWRVTKNNLVSHKTASVLHAIFTEATATVQPSQTVHLCLSDKEGPLLLGVFRPQIVFPLSHLREDAGNPTHNTTQETMTEHATQEQYLILLHELTHAKNRDNAWSALAVLALATQWYNPLVWLCFFCLKRDIERRCDATVATLTGNKQAYASVLLKTICSDL